MTPALLRLTAAHAKGDPDAIERAESELADEIARARTLAELQGRATVLLGLNRPEYLQANYADLPDPMDVYHIKAGGLELAKFRFGKVRFEQAVKSILRRVPRLARNWREVAARHAEGAIAFAKAASVNIARKVQNIFVDALIVGQDRPSAKALMQDLAGWSDAYAENVYRTNTATAYREGREEQANDPDVRDLVAGWEWDATLDSDVRPNHAAMDGVYARLEDPVWGRMNVPAGYQCRCTKRIITYQEARRRGLLGSDGELPWVDKLPPGAYPDEGFEP